MKKEHQSRGAVGGPMRHQNQLNRNRSGPYQRTRKNHPRVQNGRDQRPQGAGSGPTQNPHCYHCSKEGHKANECPHRAVVCFNCQRPGHYARDCRAPRKEPVNNNNNNNNNNQAGRPTAKGRVYHIDGEEVQTASELIQGECEISGKLFPVLYDSGATHSFISWECVNSLQLPITCLPFNLVVTIPSSEPVTLNEACLQCPLTILDMKFKIQTFPDF
ncbi:hypothetical protein QL285_027017 [Trifolium repens]|nr:hypothetical protein QL285_027017 [Trifolium repens]